MQLVYKFPQSKLIRCFVNPLLSGIHVKISCLDLEAHTSQILLHHICIQVKSVVLVKFLLFQVVAEQSFQEDLIQAIRQQTSKDDSRWEADIALAENSWALVVEDTV